MKRFNKILVVMFVGISLLVPSVAFARGCCGKGGPGYSQSGPKGYGPGHVLREEMYNARVEVLAELSELSQDDIKAKLEYKPMWAVIDEAKVDYPTFRKKMQEKAKSVLSQAVTDGKITQAQADFMQERMENGRMGGRGKGPGMGSGRNWN